MTAHGDGSDKGGIAFDEFANRQEMIDALQFWNSVHHNVGNLLMPPSDKGQLTDQEIATLTAWIESNVFRLDPESPDPGRVTIRRLNRDEYRNSIRDLLGEVSFDPAEDLPPDDTGYGFDNIGDVLTMAPALLEKYVLASDRVLSELIQSRPPEPERMVFEENQFRGVKHIGNGTGAMSSHAVVGVKWKIPREGEYLVRVLAGAEFGGDELPEMRVEFQDAEKKTFKVQAERSRPVFHEHKVRAKRGDRWMGMAFLNDFYDENAKDQSRRDRNLYIFKAELVGPLNVKPPPPPESHRKIFACAGEGTDKEKARRVIRYFGRRIWRRPMEMHEVERLAQFVDLAQAEGDSYEYGVQLALQAMLVSPNFLVPQRIPSPAERSESGPPD